MYSAHYIDRILRIDYLRKIDYMYKSLIGSKYTGNEPQSLHKQITSEIQWVVSIQIPLLLSYFSVSSPNKRFIYKISDQYKGHPGYKDCVEELDQMARDYVTCGMSLILVILKSIRQQLYDTQKKSTDSTNDVLLELALTSAIKYPLYKNLILDAIGFELKKVTRSGLLHKLFELQLYTNVKLDETDTGIMLNTYCASEIAKYLPDNDLLNLVIAFSDTKTIERPIMTSSDTEAPANKRTKLE